MKTEIGHSGIVIGFILARNGKYRFIFFKFGRVVLKFFRGEIFPKTFFTGDNGKFCLAVGIVLTHLITDPVTAAGLKFEIAGMKDRMLNMLLIRVVSGVYTKNAGSGNFRFRVRSGLHEPGPVFRERILSCFGEIKVGNFRGQILEYLFDRRC